MRALSLIFLFFDYFFFFVLFNSFLSISQTKYCSSQNSHSKSKGVSRIAFGDHEPNPHSWHFIAFENQKDGPRRSLGNVIGLDENHVIMHVETADALRELVANGEPFMAVPTPNMFDRFTGPKLNRSTTRLKTIKVFSSYGLYELDQNNEKREHENATIFQPPRIVRVDEFIGCDCFAYGWSATPLETSTNNTETSTNSTMSYVKFPVEIKRREDNTMYALGAAGLFCNSQGDRATPIMCEQSRLLDEKIPSLTYLASPENNACEAKAVLENMSKITAAIYNLSDYRYLVGEIFWLETFARYDKDNIQGDHPETFWERHKNVPGLLPSLFLGKKGTA